MKRLTRTFWPIEEELCVHARGVGEGCEITETTKDEVQYLTVISKNANENSAIHVYCLLESC